MAEELNIHKGSKEEKYTLLHQQLESLCANEPNSVANLANMAAAIKQTFNFYWVGFYCVEKESNELVLGPFQGPIACTRIKKGKGVCGQSWAEKKTLVVANVDEFPGHIACSSFSKSEIVVPLIKDGAVIGVLDVDDDKLSAFDEVDEKHLNKICAWLVSIL
ncbi:diguanylate cyclase [Brumimicrobium salinarum]|uniref:Diguanylate cyclase n=1 Tax=Brumimicrobium salinarum TaxID=2058658 RepID=A0A2I0R655_9FLAO|nr:GAF domain-containing protein [Brumimicrobium salinarum]PKR82068.1 diguanylate cyclase [Brumimicrobium salinarum]